MAGICYQFVTVGNIVNCCVIDASSTENARDVRRMARDDWAACHSLSFVAANHNGHEQVWREDRRSSEMLTKDQIRKSHDHVYYGYIHCEP